MSTYLLFWNPGVSSYTRQRFLDDFARDCGVGNWSFYEYENVKPGDTFYMVRCGAGNIGIAMKGIILTEAYASSDWSPKGRPKVHYADIYQNFTINTFASVPLLTPEYLTKEIPGVNWFGGHSGRLMSDDDARKLDALWDQYLVANPYLVKDGFAFKNQHGR